VEKVVNKRATKNGTVQYLVKWKGFPEAENEWLSYKFMHIDKAIAEYKQQGRPEGSAHSCHPPME